MDKETGTSNYSDEHEVFEIRDYTTASEWERFISFFEEILTEWNILGDEGNIVKLDLNVESLANVEWHEQTSTIQFADYIFNATHHYVSLDGKTKSSEYTKTTLENKEEMPHYLMQIENDKIDFANKSHCITRWFGLYQFVVLSPAPTMEPLTSHTRAKLVLSALAISANNINCQIPLFIQTRRSEDKIFSGVAVSNGLRTDFNMAYVKQVSRCTDLEGILLMLKEKVSLNSYPGADIAAKFTYKLSEWPDNQWKQEIPNYDPLMIDFNFSNFMKLPFGAVEDPVSELYLSTFSPSFKGEYDNPPEKHYFSKLDPNFLDEWSARIAPPNYLGKSLLADIIRAFLNTSQNKSSIRQILGPEFDPIVAEELHIGSAFDKLTASPVPSLATVISKSSFIRKRQPVSGPLCDEALNQLLTFLFPDSCPEKSECYPKDLSQIPLWHKECDEMSEEHPLKTVLSNMKSCPIDSFLWRLTIVSCYCIMSIGKAAIAQLIYEIYLEFRFRWDNSLLIPGLEEGLPNLGTCLFNQKLQMLNYCIAKRRDKEGKYKVCKPTENESDDEFFECNEDADEVSDEDMLPEWDKPVGRLRRMNNLKLINSNAYLYIPITQEFPPVTEDRLEQQKDDLMRLGSDLTASQHRARMMSSSLLSDMESFKAANPGCILEDFVRWYSPRDWLEDEYGNGHLTERMVAPGNLWQEVWQSALPVPSRRQKRLFDETRESEAVLQWVGTQRPGTFCQELLSVLAHACLARITEESILYTLPASVSILPMPLHCCSLFAQVELVAQRILRISRHCPPDLSMYEALLEQLRAIEIDITRAKSLRLKLIGHSHVRSDAFKYSRDASVDNDKKRIERNVGLTQASNLLDIPTLSRRSKIQCIEKPSEEEILEKLVYNLLGNQEISIEDSPKGTQAKSFIKLFKAAIKENSDLNTQGQDQITEQNYDYGKPEIFFLGPPYAREYLVRAKGKHPAKFSRLLPHRLFVVMLSSEFRMAGAITQDTLFC